MDLSGLAGTVTIQQTARDTFEVASLVAANGNTVPVRIVTATRPTTGSNKVVRSASLNYMKMKLHSTSNVALTVSIFGWSYSQNNLWIPQLIATLTTSAGTALQNIPGISGGSADQYEISNYVLTSGDAKIYSSPASATPGAFVLIDTLGSQLIEIYATAASTTPTVNVWTSDL